MNGANGLTKDHANGRKNGHLNGRLSLEDQNQQDIAFLRHHLLTKGTEICPEIAARADSPDQPRIARPPIFPNGIDRVETSDVTAHTSNVAGKARRQSWIRTILLDFPLLLLFGMLVLSFSVQRVYHQHYIPLLKASARAADDNNLRKELTYYERTCSVKDMTSRNGDGLLLANGTTPQEAVENMMIHGISMIPSILDQDTVKKLRRFIMRRNRELSSDEKIALSQGRNRISFGIDATEDPIIPVALKQVASHALLNGLIKGLVGDEDPAVTEITAITAAAGAKYQNWHPDVKPDGNAIKFARTYAHSYSLFIALQDVTESMGPTTMCPGTHYCANNLYDMCNEHGFHLTDACPNNVWQAGHGALLNQQVWHRGGKHYDREAKERVIFIVSFIGRPDATRQLARGTYFHQKWLSWGHTMKDLMDAHLSMAKPFSILRALSIWKPKNRNWGYDLITAALMRIANTQMGMTATEIPVFQTKVVENIFFIPRFLQGPVSEDEEDPRAWPDYLDGTLRKMTRFLTGVNGLVMIFYFFIVLVLCAKQRSATPIKHASYRMIFTHGIPILLSWRLMERMANTEYWRKAKAGQILRPPFGSHLEFIQDDTIPTGPTTLPSRDDILVGTRFDSMILGAYDRWLDYHPGNFEFITQLRHCSSMPVSLQEQYIDLILTTKRGRLLEQDWTTGDWHVMPPVDSRRYVEIEVAKARNSVVARFAKSISLLVAFNRFDTPPTALTLETLNMLLSLRKRIFPAKSNATDKTAEPNVLIKSAGKPAFFVSAIVPQLPATTDMLHIQARTRSHARWVEPRLVGEPKFKVGDLVWINYDGGGRFFRGAITKIRRRDGALNIHYDDEEKQSKVPQRFAHHDVPLVENVSVMFTKDNMRVKGQVVRIMPDGLVNIVYGSGRMRTNVDPEQYSRLDF